MSSVHDIKDCEICGGDFYENFDCHTNESRNGCSRCGYWEEELLERDEKGNAKRMPEPDSRYILEYKSGGGLGVMVAGGEFHHLEDTTEQTLKAAIDTYDEYEDGSKGYVTAMIDGKLTLLRGQLPAKAIDSFQK